MIEQLLEKIAYLEAQLEQFRRLAFGAKSEKRPAPENPDQKQIIFEGLSTPEEAAQSQEAQATEAPVETPIPDPVPLTPKTKDKPKRKELPANLPREIIKLPDPEALLAQIEQKKKVYVNTEELEKLVIVPAQMFVRVYRRRVYASPNGQGDFTCAPWPADACVIPGSQAHVSAIAHVFTQKFVEHNPLYRIEKSFERQGCKLSRSTMCGWTNQGSQLLEPVVACMKKGLLAAPYLQSDDTTVKVLDPERPGEAREARLWVYGQVGGEVVFDFQLGRGAVHPSNFLQGYEGKLQMDGYSGYDRTLRENPQVIGFGCMAHVRRKFIESEKDEPDQCRIWLDWTAQLYVTEQHAREQQLKPDQRRELRQKYAVPILVKMKAFLDKETQGALPRGNYGKALGYALNQWKFVTLYAEHGEVEIDNNLLENAIRPAALGRKNWLFVGSPAAGPACAIHYSIVASCKRFGIDPYEYYCDVLPRLATHPASAVHELTPAGWAMARAKAKAAQSAQ